MKSIFKQPKPLVYESLFNDQANQPTGSRSFNKIIFQELIPLSPTIIKQKPSKNKVKLFRFRNGKATEDILSSARSSQSKKSLKTVKCIFLTGSGAPSFFSQKQMNPLRPLHLTKLTKCSTLSLYIIIYGNPNSPRPRFSELWVGVLKELRKYDPKRLKINIFADWTPGGGKLSGQLNWWQYIFRLIQFMKNIQFLKMYISMPTTAKFKDNQAKICYYVNRIKHLSKVKRIVLGGLESAIIDSVTAYKCFLEPPAIEQAVIINQMFKLSQPLAEALNKLKNLKDFTFRGVIQIPDLFSIIQAHPGLNTVNAVGTWVHYNENIPIDTLTQDLQLQKIAHLYLDVFLPIKSKEDCSFYRRLMGVFVNLESFRIGFDTTTIKKIDFAGEYAGIFTPLKKLAHLEIALSATLENMAKFFDQMQTLTTLKHFIFAANIQVPKTVTKQLPQAIEPLRKFLLSLNSLESFEIRCHKLGLQFLQRICQIILALQNMKTITFSFETNSDKYIPLHDTMIKEIQSTMETITNTQELYVTMISSGSWDIEVPKDLVERKNENVKKFKFTIGPSYKIPSPGVRWFS